MYEGEDPPLVMTLIRREGEPLAIEYEDSINGKRVVRKMEVYKLVRDSSHNHYINKESSRVSKRISENGPYVLPR